MIINISISNSIVFHILYYCIIFNIIVYWIIFQTLDIIFSWWKPINFLSPSNASFYILVFIQTKMRIFAEIQKFISPAQHTSLCSAGPSSYLCQVIYLIFFVKLPTTVCFKQFEWFIQWKWFKAESNFNCIPICIPGACEARKWSGVMPHPTLSWQIEKGNIVEKIFISCK